MANWATLTENKIKDKIVELMEQECEAELRSNDYNNCFNKLIQVFNREENYEGIVWNQQGINKFNYVFWQVLNLIFENPVFDFVLNSTPLYQNPIRFLPQLNINTITFNFTWEVRQRIQDNYNIKKVIINNTGFRNFTFYVGEGNQKLEEIEITDAVWDNLKTIPTKDCNWLLSSYFSLLSYYKSEIKLDFKLDDAFSKIANALSTKALSKSEIVAVKCPLTINGQKFKNGTALYKYCFEDFVRKNKLNYDSNFKMYRVGFTGGWGGGRTLIANGGSKSELSIGWRSNQGLQERSIPCYFKSYEDAAKFCDKKGISREDIHEARISEFQSFPELYFAIRTECGICYSSKQKAFKFAPNALIKLKNGSYMTAAE